MTANKISEIIERLQLNLTNTTVLTEAATGAYSVTPAIAAAAGARVFAVTKNSPYGTVAEVRSQLEALRQQLAIPVEKITVIEALTPDILAKADIITNSGHLRPLDINKLQHLKKGAVLPFMYEAWEWREADLDLAYCKEKGIAVGATNERHPEVDVFGYLGDMAMKLIFDAGIALYRNKFVLISNNHFGPYIAKVLSKACAGLAVCDTAENKYAYDGLNIDWVGNFPDFEIPERYRNSEAVVFTGYPFSDKWIGNGVPIEINRLKKQLADPYILRYAGHIDEEACSAAGLRFFPAHVKPGHMGILPSTIGFDPIIRLQAAGLKVGELLLKNLVNLNGTELVQPL